MIVPRAFGHQPEFFAALEEVTRAFPPEVLSVTPSLGDDWEGEPAVYLHVVFADGVAMPRLLEVSQQLRWDIHMQLRPMEEWGVYPHFRYRTQSEQAKYEPALT